MPHPQKSRPFKPSVQWRRLLGALGLAVVIGARAAAAVDDPVPTSAPPTNVTFRQIGPGLLEIGLARLDTQRRAVIVPAFVNLREGIVEYVLVHSGGKTHESLLRTDAQPQHIHIAMLLLGARGAGTNELPADSAQALPGDDVTVEIQWMKGRRRKSVPAEEMVYDRHLRSALRKGRWIYTGSRLREDGFGAQADGSIISLITDPDALINNPRRGREDDDNWLAHGRRLPEFNTPVEVVLTLKDRPAAPRR